MMLSDFEGRYSGVPVDEAYMRLYPGPGVANRVAAHFHERLNRLFSFMNDKAGTNGHYNADQSRELLALIEEIRDAEQLLRTVGVEFHLKPYYSSVLGRCSAFLSMSYGSEIPPDFERISLVKYEPAFEVPDGPIRPTGDRAAVQLTMVGEGAFAHVYRYEDPTYGVTIALKRAKNGLGQKDLVRFRQEFDLMKSLSFPYVLEVYRYEEDRNEYTMEFCDSDLGEYMRRRNASMSFATRKRIALQLLFGLNYLHSKGVLHRDISSRNTLIQQYDGGAVIVKLSDFGLAKPLESDLTRTESEMRGTVIDPTLNSFKEYDIRSEIYAIGFVLSFIFSGRRKIDACSGEVRAIIDRCVAVDRAARYADVLAIIKEVERLPAEPSRSPADTTA